jgi:hypothetical protein
MIDKNSDEEPKVLSSNMTYIEGEDIDVIYPVLAEINNEDMAGDIAVLSHKAGRGYQRYFEFPSGTRTEKNYRMLDKRDGIIIAGTATAVTVSIPFAMVFANPLFSIPAASGLMLPHIMRKYRNEENHYKDVRTFKDAIWHGAIKTIEEETKNIKIYQVGMNELEKITGRNLEIVPSGKQKEFIEAEEDFWLLAEASGLGADAIIEYKAGSPVRGTPVRFVDKK